MAKNSTQYCVGQSLSLTRENKLKLHMLAELYGCTPSKIINSLLKDVDGPPDWASTLNRLQEELDTRNYPRGSGNNIMQKFLLENTDPKRILESKT